MKERWKLYALHKLSSISLFWDKYLILLTFLSYELVCRHLRLQKDRYITGNRVQFNERKNGAKTSTFCPKCSISPLKVCICFFPPIMVQYIDYNELPLPQPRFHPRDGQLIKMSDTCCPKVFFQSTYWVRHMDPFSASLRFSLNSKSNVKNWTCSYRAEGKFHTPVVLRGSTCVSENKKGRHFRGSSCIKCQSCGVYCAQRDSDILFTLYVQYEEQIVNTRYNPMRRL